MRGGTRYFLLCYLCGAKQFKLLHAASHAGYGLFGWCLGLIAAQSSALLLSQQWAEPGVCASRMYALRSLRTSTSLSWVEFEA